MFRRPHPSAPDYRADLDALGDAVEAAARRRAEEQRRTRGSLARRMTRWAWASRMQAVPVVILVGLFAAGLGIRAADVPVIGVVVAGLAGLGVYYWRFAIGADHVVLAMLRPVLAVAYLVASAVIA